MTYLLSKKPLLGIKMFDCKLEILEKIQGGFYEFISSESLVQRDILFSMESAELIAKVCLFFFLVVALAGSLLLSGNPRETALVRAF